MEPELPSKRKAKLKLMQPLNYTAHQFHPATSWPPSTSLAQPPRRQRFHLLSPRRHAQHADEHQHNQLSARNNPTFGALHSLPAPLHNTTHAQMPHSGLQPLCNLCMLVNCEHKPLRTSAHLLFFCASGGILSKAPMAVVWSPPLQPQKTNTKQQRHAT